MAMQTICRNKLGKPKTPFLAPKETEGPEMAIGREQM